MGVVRMVSFNGQPTQIPQSQIEAVRNILESGYLPVEHPYWSNGDEVEIVSEPLCGLRGFVTEEHEKNYFGISISKLGKSIAVKIDSRNLKRVSASEKKFNKTFSY